MIMIKNKTSHIRALKTKICKKDEKNQINKFNTDEEEWTWWELLQIIYKAMVTMDEHGNNNPALWRISTKNDGMYLAVTDGKGATR